jgi:molybdenum cofactor cytidylyltransferase
LSEVLGVFEAVAGIVLAGGESQRFGEPKQLLTWKGESFVRRVAKTALKAGLNPVLVVSGAYPEAVEKEVGDLPVQIVPNLVWRQGQGTSVSAGIKALSPASGAVVFFLADQPQIPTELVLRLLDTHARTLAPVVAPWVGQQRANPVLFDRDLFLDLSRLGGEAGGRQIFSRDDVFKVPWNDPTILLDVDTPEDYMRLQKLNG